MAQGGKRKNAGRKPIKDKKLQLSIYIRKSQIKKVGGIVKAKQLAESAITENEKS